MMCALPVLDSLAMRSARRAAVSVDEKGILRDEERPWEGRSGISRW